MAKNKTFLKQTEPYVDSFEKLKVLIEKYNNNELVDFEKVKWSKIVTHSDFTEEHMIMFQTYAQQFYEDFITTHEVSDKFLKKMYSEFIGYVNLDWIKNEEQRERIKKNL